MPRYITSTATVLIPVPPPINLAFYGVISSCHPSPRRREAGGEGCHPRLGLAEWPVLTVVGWRLLLGEGLGVHGSPSCDKGSSGESVATIVAGSTAVRWCSIARCAPATSPTSTFSRIWQ